MKLLRHPVAALIILAVLIGLCVNIYGSFQENYSFTKGDVKTLSNHTTGNIMDQLKDMNLISGVNSINTAIANLKTPGASLTDIIGALASGQSSFRRYGTTS